MVETETEAIGVKKRQTSPTSKLHALLQLKRPKVEQIVDGGGSSSAEMTETSTIGGSNNEKEEDEDDVICVEDESSDEDCGADESSRLSRDLKTGFADADGRILLNPKRAKNEAGVCVAEHLTPVLKPHQISGVRFLWQNLVESLQRYKSGPGMGCILAHSMGLGKTLQAITFTEVFLRVTPGERVLALVPVNVLENWLREFDVWLPPPPPSTSSVSAGSGDAKLYQRPFRVFCMNDNSRSKRDRAELISEWFHGGGVMLMGYECFCAMSMVRSADTFKPGGSSGGSGSGAGGSAGTNGGPVSASKRRKSAQISAIVDEVIGRSDSSADLQQCEVIDIEQEEMLDSLVLDLRRALLDPGPDLIICDEGHRIRNMKTKTAVTLSQIRTRRRLVLTGYPLQNNLREYWCMVNFVRPNFLGSKAEFCNMFERPIANGQCVDSTASDVRLMRQRTHVLTRMLRGFVQRRSHALLKDILPPKYEFVIFVKKTPVQAQLYSAFMNYCKNEVDPDDPKMNPLRAFAVCCKIWNHPDILYNLVNQLGLIHPSGDLARKSFSSSSSSYLNPASSSDPDSIDFHDLGLSRQSSVSDESSHKASSSQFASMDYGWAENALYGYIPGLIETSTKFTLIFDIIHDSVLAGDKILIFSQSLFALNTLEAFLTETPIPGRPPLQAGSSLQHHPQSFWRKNVSYVRLDGAVNCSEREKLIDRFNSDPGLRVFLISTRAGSLGINLVGANRVIVMDASWNPCHDAQAVCRVYRYGQRKPCFIYRLITDNSMEMVIFRRQINKQGISENVVDSRAVSTAVTNRELVSLLEYDPERDRLAADPQHVVVGEAALNELAVDPALMHVCSQRRSMLSQTPLFHESLILDLGNQSLSKAEKREARLQYRQELRQLRGGYYTGIIPASLLQQQLAAGGPNHLRVPSAPPGGMMPHWVPGSDPHRFPLPPGSATPIPGSIIAKEMLGAGTSSSGAVPVESRQNRRRNCSVIKISLPYEMYLPSVTCRGVSVSVAAGTPGYLVRTAEGVYFRDKDGHVFDVTRTPIANPECAAIKMQNPARQSVSQPPPCNDDLLDMDAAHVLEPSMSRHLAFHGNETVAGRTDWSDFRDSVVSSRPPAIVGPRIPTTTATRQDERPRSPGIEVVSYDYKSEPKGRTRREEYPCLPATPPQYSGAANRGRLDIGSASPQQQPDVSTYGAVPGGSMVPMRPTSGSLIESADPVRHGQSSNPRFAPYTPRQIAPAAASHPAHRLDFISFTAQQDYPSASGFPAYHRQYSAGGPAESRSNYSHPPTNEAFLAYGRDLAAQEAQQQPHVSSSSGMPGAGGYQPGDLRNFGQSFSAATFGGAAYGPNSGNFRGSSVGATDPPPLIPSANFASYNAAGGVPSAAGLAQPSVPMEAGAGAPQPWENSPAGTGISTPESFRGVLQRFASSASSSHSRRDSTASSTHQNDPSQEQDGPDAHPMDPSPNSSRLNLNLLGQMGQRQQSSTGNLANHRAAPPPQPHNPTAVQHQRHSMMMGLDRGNGTAAPHLLLMNPGLEGRNPHNFMDPGSASRGEQRNRPPLQQNSSLLGNDSSGLQRGYPDFSQ